MSLGQVLLSAELGRHLEPNWYPERTYLSQRETRFEFQRQNMAVGSLSVQMSHTKCDNLRSLISRELGEPRLRAMQRSPSYNAIIESGPHH